MEVYCICGSVLYLWKCFVFVEVFCICGSVLYLWKCFVFVEVFCDLWKCFVPMSHRKSEISPERRWKTQG